MADQNSSSASLDTAATRLLRLLTGLFVFATVACFMQSYRQLFDWATTHRVPMWQAWAWPAGVDAPIVMGEILLFVAIVRRWPWFVKLLGLLVALGGFAASLAANVGFLPAAASYADRWTAAMAPIVASVSLTIALIAAHYVARAQRDTTQAERHVVLSAPSRPAVADAGRGKTIDEVAAARRRKRRAPIRYDSPEADRARTAIAVARASGDTLPTPHALGMIYLGGDPESGRRGNERLAKQLLDEAAQ